MHSILALGAAALSRVNEFPQEHAAVCAFAPGPSLITTSFYPAGADAITYVADARAAFVLNHTKPGAINASILDAAAVWPNQANPVPAGAVGGNGAGDLVLTAGGFFVSPGKSTGAVSLLNVSAFRATGVATKRQLSTDKKGNFYHQAEWYDVNGDGRLDVVAARAYKSMFNPFAKAEGALVWLEQPAEPRDEGVERQLTGLNGPGVAFALIDLDGDGKDEIVAAQYFVAKQLSIWQCEHDLWSQCVNGSGVTSAVVNGAESDGAPFFAVEWADLNGDGKKRELLATTNTANGKGAVFVYESSSSSSSSSSWTAHKIADGYKPKKAFLPGRGSPGRATSFMIHKDDKYASILVSADDGGWVDLLTPDLEAWDATPYTYTKTRVLNSTDTVGTPAIMDVNGDGWADFAVPLFAENKVALYSFHANDALKV